MSWGKAHEEEIHVHVAGARAVAAIVGDRSPASHAHAPCPTAVVHGAHVDARHDALVRPERIELGISRATQTRSTHCTTRANDARRNVGSW